MRKGNTRSLGKEREYFTKFSFTVSGKYKSLLKSYNPHDLVVREIIISRF